MKSIQRSRCLVRCVMGGLFIVYSSTVSAKPESHTVAAERDILLPYQSQIHQRFTTHSPLVSYILKKLDTYALPERFVLIPMLESSFNAKAISHANAAGLWQLMPATATRFGLSVSKTDDQRFDELASTEAAIKYLAFLYRKFEGNETLTLAAYNAGEGRVQRAINRQNNAHFTSLSLPKETKTYIARFYALDSLIDISSLKGQHFQPFSLFANTPQITAKPLIDFQTLPPLISL